MVVKTAHATAASAHSRKTRTPIMQRTYHDFSPGSERSANAAPARDALLADAFQEYHAKSAGTVPLTSPKLCFTPTACMVDATT